MIEKSFSFQLGGAAITVIVRSGFPAGHKLLFAILKSHVFLGMTYNFTKFGDFLPL